VPKTPTISGDELRARVDRLGSTYGKAAAQLGLTRDGLNKQMRGISKVSRQTEIILELIDEVQRLKSELRREELPLDRQAALSGARPCPKP